MLYLAMKRFPPVLLFIILSSWCFAAPPTIVFKGKVDAAYNNSKIVLTNLSSYRADTIIVRNGAFSFRVPAIENELYVLVSRYEQDKYEYPLPLGILVEGPGIISINATGRKLRDAVVKGSAAQVIYEKFISSLKELINLKLKQETAIANGITGDTSIERKAVLLLEDSVRSQLALQTALKNRYSFAAVYILENFGSYLNKQDVEQVYYSFSQKLQHSFHGKKIQQWLQELKSSERGQTVADFSLPDSSGKIIGFGELKDKVILINFWASWCAPCREEFKSLRRLYDKFHYKGFTVLSISVDASPALWKKTLQKEQLPWVQMHDTRPGINIAARRFEVTSLPTTFLLDADRKILYRDLRGGTLDKVIEGLLDQ
jgi:peroxiredoxin